MKCAKKIRCRPYRFSAKNAAGFTLVETLVAISLLSIAIVAPIGLTVQSISSAYYARDQITAYYLAQEALEAVRQIRDNNILTIATTNNPNIDIFENGIPDTSGGPMTIDARNNYMQKCTEGWEASDGGCPFLETDKTLYGYPQTTLNDNSNDWTNTYFRRTVEVCFIQKTENGSFQCNGNPSDEARVSVTVSWQTGNYKTRSFTISEELYRWVQDGSGAS